MTPNELARELRELIAALDRRVPHLERIDETVIARDASALRELAVRRLRELEEGNEESVVQPRDDSAPNRA